MRSWVLASLVVGGLGCGDEVRLAAREVTDTFNQTGTDQVDILWVVDNSNSMQVEQALLGSGFRSFAAELEATRTDFHIGVITTDFDVDNPNRGVLISEAGCPAVITPETVCGTDEQGNERDYASVFVDRAQVGLNGSGKEKGLEVAYYALSPAIATTLNAGFLRPNANLLVIIVSDEEDCSDDGRLAQLPSDACYGNPELLTPVGSYVTRFQSLKSSKDKVQLGAIVGPEQADALCDDTTLPGRRYTEVSRLTGGLSSSICESDWSQMLYELGLNATGILVTFQLSSNVREGTLEVRVDGEVVPESEQDGYTYDATTDTITFHGIYVPQRGAEILVTYEAG